MPPLVSWAVPGPTSVERRGGDGGATAWATDFPFLPAHAPTAPFSPKSFPAHRSAFNELASKDGGFGAAAGR